MEAFEKKTTSVFCSVVANYREILIIFFNGPLKLEKSYEKSFGVATVCTRRK
jgi:hypothetical protein